MAAHLGNCTRKLPEQPGLGQGGGLGQRRSRAVGQRAWKGHRAAMAVPTQHLFTGLLSNNDNNYRIAFIELLLCARHHSKCFTHTETFDAHNNPVK